MLLKKTEDLYLDLNGLEGIKSGLAELNRQQEFSNLKSIPRVPSPYHSS
ncbi:hypothetical protein Goari_022576, partial [Gossypium aridum]|nr:hypothetical protein [Gossypium aridum]